MLCLLQRPQLASRLGSKVLYAHFYRLSVDTTSSRFVERIRMTLLIFPVR